MPRLLYVLRYFRVVSPIPGLLITSFAVITVVGGLTTALAGDQRGAALVPVVVLQAFSSATGFAAPARRGYFDLLVARGEPRVRIAMVQWGTAIAPGFLSWVALAVIYALGRGLVNNPFLTSGSVLAFVVVSTIPWAVTVPLPRFSGAIGWLLVICLGDVGGVAWPDSIRGVFYPVSLVGRDVEARFDILIPAVLLSIVSVTVALLWVHRTDIPLEAAQ